MGKASKSTGKTAGRGERDSLNWRDFDPSWLPDGEKDALATEFATYRDRLDELLEHEGQYVVIKGDRVLGYYRTWKSAISAAHKAFGHVPVLVKRVVEIEPFISLGGVIL